MTCRDLAEHLLDLVEDALSADLRQQAEEHLRECKPCVTFVETYRLTVHLSRRLPCSELPENLRCRCEELLRHQTGAADQV